MPRPRYKVLVDQLAQDIRLGRLPAGTRLPTHRALSKQYGVALVTASRIYAELQTMGLVSGEPGRGTFVKDTALPVGHGVDYLRTPPDLLDLSFNSPVLSGQADLLRTALRQLAAVGDLESLLHYLPHSGRQRDRHAIAQHLQSSGLLVSAEQILITDGAQHGLAITVMGLLQPGDVVAVDALTYPGFKLLARTCHLELQAIATTAHGPDLDALEALCQRRRVRAVYTMPTLHNPLGWVMSTSQRKRLVAIARRHGLLLIEDAAYAYLAAPAPAPLAAMAPECTVYVSGLSKNLATGLRVGFVVAPPAWVPQLESSVRATTWNTPGLMTAIACRWLEDGTVTRLEAEKRSDAAQRQALVAQLLPSVRTLAHPHSYFVWLPLEEDRRADQIASALLRQGIAVSTAAPYCTSPQVPHALRLALGSVSLSQLAVALRKLHILL